MAQAADGVSCSLDATHLALASGCFWRAQFWITLYAKFNPLQQYSKQVAYIFTKPSWRFHCWNSYLSDWTLLWLLESSCLSGSQQGSWFTWLDMPLSSVCKPANSTVRRIMLPPCMKCAVQIKFDLIWLSTNESDGVPNTSGVVKGAGDKPAQSDILQNNTSWGRSQVSQEVLRT